MRATSSASRTCGAWRSASVWTAMARMPSRRRVRMTRRAISPRLATRADSNMPLHRAGHERVRAERPAEVRLRLPGGGEQRRQVDPGLHAHLAEHRHDVLGGDVARRARGHRAAAELAEARLEGPDARLP